MRRTKFIHFEQYAECLYPVESYIMVNQDYAENVANTIVELYHGKDIALIVRGHSGTLLAGMVSYILISVGYDVQIYISRKSTENSHGENLNGLESLEFNRKIIVLDDFVETGETITTIIDDVRQYFDQKLDCLFVSNRWSRDYTPSHLSEFAECKILKNFKHICCNKSL